MARRAEVWTPVGDHGPEVRSYCQWTYGMGQPPQQACLMRAGLLWVATGQGEDGCHSTRAYWRAIMADVHCLFLCTVCCGACSVAWSGHVPVVGAWCMDSGFCVSVGRAAWQFVRVFCCALWMGLVAGAYFLRGQGKLCGLCAHFSITAQTFGCKSCIRFINNENPATIMAFSLLTRPVHDIN